MNRVPRGFARATRAGAITARRTATAGQYSPQHAGHGAPAVTDCGGSLEPIRIQSVAQRQHRARHRDRGAATGLLPQRMQRLSPLVAVVAVAQVFDVAPRQALVVQRGDIDSARARPAAIASWSTAGSPAVCAAIRSSEGTAAPANSWLGRSLRSAPQLQALPLQVGMWQSWQLATTGPRAPPKRPPRSTPPAAKADSFHSV